MRTRTGDPLVRVRVLGPDGPGELLPAVRAAECVVEQRHPDRTPVVYLVSCELLADVLAQMMLTPREERRQQYLGRVRRPDLLPPGCAYISSAERDTTDPHLIVQFREGERVRSGDIDVYSPHPNRLIYTNDPPNRELVLSDDLGSVLSTAEVFMISAFNVAQDPALLDQRLHRLREHMRRLPPGAVVYYEDAGFHVPALSRQVRDALIEVIDVYSMNEDEMQAYAGRSLDLLDVGEMVRALTELHAVIPAAVLVVHSKYWSLAFGDRAETLAASLQGGITMASTRYLHGDGFTERDYRDVGKLPVNPRGVEFARALESRLGPAVRCVPALVLDTEHPTTIGLGDTFAGGFLAALVRT